MTGEAPAISSWPRSWTAMFRSASDALATLEDEGTAKLPPIHSPYRNTS